MSAPITDLEAKYAACKLEAQTHSMEADTQRSTVFECYAAAGVTGKADWNGAEPVRQAFAALEAQNRQLRELVLSLGGNPDVEG